LIAKTNKFRIAKKDITVYAIKKKGKMIGKKITVESYFNSASFDLGVRKRDKNPLEPIGTTFNGMYIFGKGVFHVMPTVRYLKADLHILSDGTTVIVKGYIPKGSKYIVGVNDTFAGKIDGKKTYGAKEIVFTEIIWERKQKCQC